MHFFSLYVIIYSSCVKKMNSSTAVRIYVSIMHEGKPKVNICHMNNDNDVNLIYTYLGSACVPSGGVLT